MVGPFSPLRWFPLVLLVIFFPNLNFLSVYSKSKYRWQRGGLLPGLWSWSQVCGCGWHSTEPGHRFLVLYSETGQTEALQTSPQGNEIVRTCVLTHVVILASNVTLTIGGPYLISVCFTSLNPAKSKWIMVDDGGSFKYNHMLVPMATLYRCGNFPRAN